ELVNGIGSPVELDVHLVDIGRRGLAGEEVVRAGAGVARRVRQRKEGHDLFADRIHSVLRDDVVREWVPDGRSTDDPRCKRIVNLRRRTGTTDDLSAPAEVSTPFGL